MTKRPIPNPKQTKPSNSAQDKNIHISVNQTESYWKKGYYIATFIIALMALAGLYSSYKSTEASNNVAATLKTVKNDFENMLTPVISFKDYKWILIGTDNNKISCDNPPSGIQIEYWNPSDVTIEILKTESQYFFGDKQIDESTRHMAAKGTMIMAPKESSFNQTTQRGPFNQYLGTAKKRFDPPYFRVTLDVEYRRYGDSKKYRYYTEQQFLFDCSHPKSTQLMTVDEYIKVIE